MFSGSKGVRAIDGLLYMCVLDFRAGEYAYNFLAPGLSTGSGLRPHSSLCVKNVQTKTFDENLSVNSYNG